MLLIFFLNGSSSDSSWTKSGQTFADIQQRGKCSPLCLVCIKTGNPKSNGLNMFKSHMKFINSTYSNSNAFSFGVPNFPHLGSYGFCSCLLCCFSETNILVQPPGVPWWSRFYSEVGQEKQNYGHLIPSGDISGIVEVPTILWMVAKSCTTWDARKPKNNGILLTY